MSTPGEPPRDAEEARLDIELTRKELGDTAEALMYKLNVPARTREQVQEHVTRMQGQVRERSARARQQLQHGTTKAVDTARANPGPAVVVLAVAALAVGAVIVWRMRR
ncbi:DUF3618 domain-containing protein [Saccharomonospora sp. NPDC046836]|uniref:DUF3618 domain-containing protein n=1 Tax=Saccharomonospora sp. NPDC046836 TaxID=3156921 RepID=UPI0033F13861